MAEKIRVLVAEDIEPLREELAALIEQQPDMCLAGQSDSGKGITALGLETDFDVCLMDVEMESHNAGIHAAEALLEEKPDVKIIFLTIHETREIVLSAMATGAVDYVVKGGDPDELLRHVREAYAGNAALETRFNQMLMEEYARLRKSEKSLIFFINSVSRLTSAERELIAYLLQGYNLTEIAHLRVVEKSTVKSQMKGVLHKFGCGRSKEIVEMIRSLGIEHLFLK